MAARVLFAVILVALSLSPTLPSSAVHAATRPPLMAAPAQPAATTVNTNITANTEWTAAGSPYLVTSSINVAAGATLTVDPGVTVQFSQFTGITINGTLIASGTQAAPIVFIPSTADPQQQVNWWNGLQIAGTASAPNTASRLSYVTVSGGGQNAGADVVLEYAYAAIDHSTFSNSGSEGIRGLTGSWADVTDTAFTNNGNGDPNGGFAIWYHDPTHDPILSGLTATGNRLNTVGIGDAYAYQTPITGTQTWEFAGIPYQIAGSLVTAPGSQLNVASGVPVLFDQYTGITLNGTLAATGTQTSPILFTPSITDTQQQVNWWNGLKIAGTASVPNIGSHLSYVTISGGGQNSGADLVLEHAHAKIDHSTFSNSGSEGIRGLEGGWGDVTDTAFTNNGNNDPNGGFAIWYRDPTPDAVFGDLTATGNRFNVIGIGDPYAYQTPITGTQTWEFAGIPYQIAGSLTSAPGSQLIVDPGVTVTFSDSTSLDLHGRLVAEGSEDRPIIFKGASSQPGSWNGIHLTGTADTPNEGSSLSYVTITGAGGGDSGNLMLTFAAAVVGHSIISNSTSDGVRVIDGGGTTVIQASQIVNNTKDGIRNQVPDTFEVLAPNNWWGASSGPSFDGAPAACTPVGTGSAISAGVDFDPFLTSIDAALPGPMPAGNIQVQINPQMWFAPSDGTTRDYLTITVLDAGGNPLANQQVHVVTDLGTAVDGTVTGPDGKSTAYLTSGAAGDAHVTVQYQPDASKPCVVASTPATTITFQPVDTGEGLVSVPAAPYVSDDIIVPEPPVRGIPSQVSVRVHNPSATNPLSVTARFEYAQSGVGLTFGPVGQASIVIVPGGTSLLSANWTPPISGHYCFQVTITGQEIAPAGQSAQGELKQFEWHGQRNVNVEPGSLGPRNEKNAIQKATFAGDTMEDSQFVLGVLQKDPGLAPGFVQGALFDNILSFIHQAGGVIICGLGGGAECGGWSGPSLSLPGGSLSDDPPRQDYRIIATLPTITVPIVTPNDQIPAARAKALNDFMAASVDLAVKLQAAVISYDRYGGAAAAGDVGWESQQTAAYVYYKKQAGAAMIQVANTLDALQAEMKSEGFADYVVTPDAVRAYQNGLRQNGFSPEAIEAAHTLGLTDGIIESIRQVILAEDPVANSGGQFAHWSGYASALRYLGQTILTPPPIFSPVIGARAGVRIAEQATVPDARLIAPYAHTMQIQAGNPLDHAATINLRIRRIDIPADWQVTVSPSSVTLAPGEQITATITVVPGLPGVQGYTPRLAVEGYAEGKLLGGVELGVALPEERDFDGTLHIQIPLTARQ